MNANLMNKFNSMFDQDSPKRESREPSARSTSEHSVQAKFKQQKVILAPLKSGDTPLKG